MSQSDLASSRKRLIKICGEEIRKCLRAGHTDLETVATRVETRCSMLIDSLASKLAKAEVRSIIRRMLKKTEVKPANAAAIVRQLEFADMEEFRGIPPTVTYEDRPGHTDYIPYLQTHEFERAAALQLLAKSLAFDQQTYLAMKAGNEFASNLVAIYGDLPLWELYQKHKQASLKRRINGQ